MTFNEYKDTARNEGKTKDGDDFEPHKPGEQPTED